MSKRGLDSGRWCRTGVVDQAPFKQASNEPKDIGHVHFFPWFFGLVDNLSNPCLLSGYKAGATHYNFGYSPLVKLESCAENGCISVL